MFRYITSDKNNRFCFLANVMLFKSISVHAVLHIIATEARVREFSNYAFRPFVNFYHTRNPLHDIESCLPRLKPHDVWDNIPLP